MKIEKETIVILFLIALVMGPMWYLALVSATSQTEVVLSQNKGNIAPTERFIPSPVEVNEFMAGVIVWLALLILVWMIFYTHEFIRIVGQAEEPVVANGGIQEALPSYFLSDDRWIADYWPAQFDTPGMIGIVAMSWSATVFAILFVMEALTWARTQFLGVYGGMMFLSLGVLVAVYSIWFLPSIHLVEKREHEEIISESGESENQ